MRSRPELSQSVSATLTKSSLGTPQASSTSSGVYRLKCFRSSWYTHRGCWSVGSRLIRAAGEPVRSTIVRLPAAAAIRAPSYCQDALS